MFYFDHDLINKLKKLWFLQSPIIIDLLANKTQSIIDDKILVFGIKYEGILDVCHEMGHFIEIDDARILSLGWGLNCPREYISGRYGRWAQIPKTYQDVERECRVAAIQSHIERSIGIERSLEDLVDSFEFLPGFQNIPWSEFTTVENAQSYKKSIVVALAKSAHEKYTYQSVRVEWHRKTNLLKNKRESEK